MKLKAERLECEENGAIRGKKNVIYKKQRKQWCKSYVFNQLLFEGNSKLTDYLKK